MVLPIVPVVVGAIALLTGQHYFISTNKEQQYQEKLNQEKQHQDTLKKAKTELENKQKDCEGLIATLKKAKTELENKQKDCEGLTATLKEAKTELEKQTSQVKAYLEEVGKEMEANNKRLWAVEKEITEKELTPEKRSQLLRKKEQWERDQWKLDETKKSHERHLLYIEKLLDDLIAMKNSSNSIKATWALKL